MTNGMREPGHVKLLGDGAVIVIAGVLSLAFYWAWIFSTYSGCVLNPFGEERVPAYLALLVCAAGSSAAGMLVAALVADRIEGMLGRPVVTLLLAVLSALGCLPALLFRLGVDLAPWQVVAPWVVANFASAFVYLLTGPFFVWLRRSKLSRCIALSFLFAALLYALAQLLAPLSGVVMVMLFPVASCACMHVARGHMAAGANAHVGAQELRGGFAARVRELRYFMPMTLIYTVSFGVVSCIVLMLASRIGLVYVIALSILVASVFLVAYSFTHRDHVDSERFRRFLLPLIAVAVLPFPYLPDIAKVVFLSAAVFGFTCFDAIGWGDLADEVRERDLRPYGYLSTATVVNFVGVFLGWGGGYLLITTLGDEGLGVGFGVFSCVVIVVLIVDLVVAGWHSERDSVQAAPAYEFQDVWRDACLEVARSHGLSNQEERIFLMLARGRNQKFIADELYISSHTVKTHVYHIYKKLDIHSQQELVNVVDTALR